MTLRSHDKRDRGIIIFRLMGVDKMMNIYEFYIIYEFESTGFQESLKERNIYNDVRFWRQKIHNEEVYNPSISQSIHLISVILCYMHRVITHTICGWSVGGVKVRIIDHLDMSLLWCMVKGHKLNTRFFLLSHLKRISYRRKDSDQGLITAIAYYYGEKMFNQI